MLAHRWLKYPVQQSLDRKETSTDRNAGYRVILIPKCTETEKRGQMPSLQECKAQEYCFNQEKVNESFKELLEQNILTLPEVKRPDEVGQNNNPKYCPYYG